MALQQLRKELGEKDSATAVASDQRQKWQAEKDELLRNHMAALEQNRTATEADKVTNIPALEAFKYKASSLHHSTVEKALGV